MLYALILVLAVFLGTYDLGQRDLFYDEVGSANLASLKTEGLQYRTSPLYYFLLRLWPKFGPPEISLRLFSVTFGVSSLFILFFLMRLVFDEQIASLSVLIMSVSPFFIFMCRQATPYAIFLFISLCNLYCYFSLLRGKSPRRWALYVITAISGLLVHEGLLYLLAMEAVHAVFSGTGGRDGKKKLAFMIILMAALFLVLIELLMKGRFKNIFYFALFRDKYNFLPYSPLSKIFYTFFVFSVGETVLPWSWHITIPSFFAFAAMAWLGLRRSLSHGRDRSLVFLVFLFIPVLALNSLKSFFPRYLFPALPFYAALISCGLSGVRNRVFKTACILVIIASSGYSLFNYYTGREYHNNIYLDPWREVASYIRDNIREGDIIVTVRPNMPLLYYYGKTDRQLFYTISFSLKKEMQGFVFNVSEKALEAHRRSVRRVWYIKNAPGLLMSRLMTEEELERRSEAFGKWLNANFVLVETRKYLHDEHAPIKRKFIDKIFLDDRITVFLYEGKGEGVR
ncbi:MAG: glycosyltransferase family 39 protein [Candidatus Omnitrophota bacterium]